MYIIIFLLYIFLGLELLFLPVPSVASSFSLWKYPIEKTYSSQWVLLKKILFLGFPVIIIIIVFSIPVIRAMGGLKNWMVLFDGSLWTDIISIGLMLIGRFITLSSVLKIRKSINKNGDSFELHKDSHYANSRNPIQVGMYIFSIGVFIWFPSPVLLTGFLFYAFYMHYKIKIEEDYLKKKFENSYIDYVKKTKRYL